MQTGTRMKGRGESKDKTMVWSNCHQAGHDATNCFQLVRYPDWWGDRPLGEGRGGGRGKG